ncbi:hypothetical protein BURKHO8Y_240253 [Burkholderia sp. 8Y]|nr:hypothetical protein BURKHO8Y_240253 [Burkholderia sp. 8Y]
MHFDVSSLASRQILELVAKAGDSKMTAGILKFGAP